MSVCHCLVSTRHNVANCKFGQMEKITDSIFVYFHALHFGTAPIGKFLCDIQVREHIWLRPLEEPELSLATQSGETIAWLLSCKDQLGGNIC